jgi:hypothetical protein
MLGNIHVSSGRSALILSSYETWKGVATSNHHQELYVIGLHFGLTSFLICVILLDCDSDIHCDAHSPWNNMMQFAKRIAVKVKG